MRPCRKNVEARNSDETRGDTCRLEAKYIEIPESTRMFHGLSCARASSSRCSSSSSSSVDDEKCLSSVFQLRDFRQRDGGGPPSAPAGIPRKKARPLARIMVRPFPLFLPLCNASRSRTRSHASSQKTDFGRERTFGFRRRAEFLRDRCTRDSA